MRGSVLVRSKFSQPLRSPLPLSTRRSWAGSELKHIPISAAGQPCRPTNAVTRRDSVSWWSHRGRDWPGLDVIAFLSHYRFHGSYGGVSRPTGPDPEGSA